MGQRSSRPSKSQETITSASPALHSGPASTKMAALRSIPRKSRSKKQQVAAKANGVMEQTRDYTASTPFPFLQLPNELRNKVYKYALISPFALRRIETIKPGPAGRMVATKEHATPPSFPKAIHRNEIRLPSWPATALLFTCRSIYNEGLSIVYSCNKVHFPALSKGLMLNKRQQTSFSLLQHVSFDYSHTHTSSWDEYRKNIFWTKEVATHVDTTISVAVKQIAKGCPVLKTLTLHVLSFPAFVHLTALAAHNKCATTIALSKMELERLTIVGIAVRFGYGVLRPRERIDNQTVFLDTLTVRNNSEYALLNSIAPWDLWRKDVTNRPGFTKPWPGLRVNTNLIERDISISVKEPFPLYEYQNDTRDDFMMPATAQAWHLRRAPYFSATEIRSYVPVWGITMGDLLEHFEGQIMGEEDMKQFKQLVEGCTRYEQVTNRLFPL